MYTLLIVFFAVAIIVSFLCSLWESVLLSITPTYAQIKLQEGKKVGRYLQSFKSNIDRPLAAILTLNTIAHTVGAIGVGSQAARIWADASPVITSFVIPALMTLGILVLSEIIPKTIGANYWKQFTPFTVRSLLVVISVLLPLVWLSQLITKVLKKDKASSVLSRSEFSALADIGINQGVFNAEESKMIKGLLRFNTVRAKDIMTPRPVVMVASENISLRAFYEGNEILQFSRIPLYEGTNSEEIIGYILKDDLLENLAQGKDEQPLRTLCREILVISEACPIPSLFNQFLEKREHIALVVDEFGGMSGIVSMEDVIETLLGMEIMDEQDNAKNMQELARRNWETRAKRFGLFSQDKDK